MCGIYGMFGGGPGFDALAPARAALARMRPRGPDMEGLWQGPGAVLGHRRLAILDLEERAGQPMHSACGRFVIVFNGEIYNFRALRRELAPAVRFRTESDTEVLLELFARYQEGMLSRLRGMFALVIYDQAARRAFAARDPYGIKPLYLAEGKSGVLIASQVKALLATGLVDGEPDPTGQAGFWMLGSVPEPRTWFRDIRALPAGHFAWIDATGVSSPSCWCDIGQAWRDAEEAPPRLEREVTEAVRTAVRNSIADHFIADVPVSILLSGGIDSSVLAAVSLEQGHCGLQGVTLGFPEYSGLVTDEVPDAKRCAHRFGMRHYVRVVKRGEFLADIEQIMDDMDQPSIDGINTWYACKAVAECGHKVVLSGVGGDELFQGYGHFAALPRMLGALSWLRLLPGFSLVADRLGRIKARRSGNRRWEHFETWSQTIEGAWWLRRSLNAPETLPELMGEECAAEVLKDFDLVAWVRAMTGPLPRDRRLALGQIESMSYLRNQLLRDADWASMAHSIELRTPFVDACLLRELSGAIGAFGRYGGKKQLACAPEQGMLDLLDRRKTGFGIPVTHWLCGHEEHLAHAWAPFVATRYRCRT